ncbi:MAG: hypothetical protein ACTSRP_09150 [Candidatus Helarchaeota archaeon]
MSRRELFNKNLTEKYAILNQNKTAALVPEKLVNLEWFVRTENVFLDIKKGIYQIGDEKISRFVLQSMVRAALYLLNQGIDENIIGEQSEYFLRNAEFYIVKEKIASEPIVVKPPQEYFIDDDKFVITIAPLTEDPFDEDEDED